MQIWPAIDLRDGKCVRLVQGDYQREMIFGEDPAAMARQWVEQGAECLHLVDLDGAKEGRPRNLDAVRDILAAIDVPCELGGGIRDEATVEQLLELGVSRLVMGTAALKAPDRFREIVRRFPDRLVLGIDARGGQVATEGWLDNSETPAAELAQQFAGEPIAAIVYTDIARDGMLNGPNLEETRKMRQATEIPIVASGGVTTVADIAKLTQLDVAGAIVGRALYEGNLTLADALAAAKGSAVE
ncbi:MAG: 1-(5-phosphoribosyl)-5-[(5-phosphoribosylamino)methylideneamino]imidazole-4-carboxamide isomerase [Planctomycetales bacterium]|nr:1-(5-phosphoribosyl)-5-[(5-phosphoribosylamino)methylideneamino]imidazole-4-carboxamide isomerase [Planctomycetales bacterium]